MRILEVSSLYRLTPPTGSGSIEKFVHMLSTNILEKHEYVEIYVMSKKGSNGGNYKTIPTDFDTYEKDILDTIKQVQPDIIHLHFDNLKIHTELLKLNLPIVYTIHSYSEPSQWLDILRASQNKSNIYFTFVSDYIKTYFESVLIKNSIDFDKDKFITSWIGIDLKYVLNNQVHKYPKEYTVYLGLIRKHKAVLEIVKAFQNLDEKLLVVGPIKNIPYCDEVIQEIRKSPNITYYGEIGTDKERIEIFSKAKALIIATGYSKLEPDCHEAFGTVMIEANASGIPIIGYNQGVMTTYIEEGVNGYKFDDINDIQKIINKLQDKDMKVECIKKATPFEIERISELYFDILSNILSNTKVDNHA